MIDSSIKNRRSISSFIKKDVPDALIDELIEISSYAPSSCNTQPWFFLVCRSEEARNKLNDYIQKGYDRTMNDMKRDHAIFGELYVKLLTFFSQYGKFNEAPVLILLFAKPYDTPVFSQAIKFSKNAQIEKIADDSVKTSSAMAMQNFLLVAHERGLWTRVKDGIKFLMSYGDLKTELYKDFKILESYELISWIQLGYPSEEALKRKPPDRLPIDQARRFL